MVPDPAFFFMSRSHEEALAHFKYAISAGDGFAVVTGEVGTGKTTLCRYYLNHIDDKVESAYVFNPTLNPRQLLLTILEEFGIRYKKDVTTKELLDLLNNFLMTKKAEGKDLVVLIDEAQNLDIKVLELLRLLSNLETHKSKLLQIILIGQPELRDVLESHELRQLDQRINLRWHLTPLQYEEVRDYITHRIQVASVRPVVKFTDSAYRAIYKYSGGIPRLINIACDRSLISAFSKGQKKITDSTVKAAIVELSGRGRIKRQKFGWTSRATIPFSLAGIAVLSLFFLLRFDLIDTDMFSSVTDQKESQTLSRSTAEPVDNALSREGTPTPAGKPISHSAEWLETLNPMDSTESRNKAFQQMMTLWGEDTNIEPSMTLLDTPDAFYRLASKKRGIQAKQVRIDFDLLQRLNHPAVIEIEPSDGDVPLFFALRRLSGGIVTLGGMQTDQWLEVDIDTVRPLFNGLAYIFWKDFLSYGGTVPLTAPKESIITLKMHLKDIGYTHLSINAEYDEQTEAAVKEVQTQYGLKPDGIVGSMTKIALYNEKASLEIPRLN